jgi:radical SAM protein with 4Fe4S-binding SPASM domain
MPNMIARAYSPFRHLPAVFSKHRPIQLTLFLTRRCNARCKFCFYLTGESGSRREPGEIEKGSGENGSEMSLAEIEQLSSSLGSLLWLAFSGGEPFLREDLTEISRVFYKRNRPSIILIPTNGLLPELIRAKTAEILEQCRKSTVVVKLSLDGPEEVHDRLRGVPGAYRKTMETYRLLRRLLDVHPNFELGINSVFCRENQGHMDDLIASIRTMPGVRTHTVSLIRGKVAEGDLKNVDPEAYARAAECLARDMRHRSGNRYRFSGSGLKAAQDILQRRLIHRTVTEQARQIPCYAGRLTLVVTEDGDCYPCESFAANMGNLREFGCDLKKLLKTKKAYQALHSIQQANCHCTHECYMMMNILFNPALYPALIKEYLRIA